MGTKLPRKLEQKMQIVGEQIRLARLRRNLSIARLLLFHASRKAHRQWQLVFISGCFMHFSWMMIFFCLQKKM